MSLVGIEKHNGDIDGMFKSGTIPGSRWSEPRKRLYLMVDVDWFQVNVSKHVSRSGVDCQIHQAVVAHEHVLTIQQLEWPF